MTPVASILLAAAVWFVAIEYTNDESPGGEALQDDGPSQDHAAISRSRQRKAIPPVTDEERRRSGTTWLYAAGFQSYVVNVVDPVSGHALHVIPVTAQAPGVAIAPDGSRLYIVDGERDGQLLVYDTATWDLLHREPVKHRAELIGGNPLSLSGDGRWLLVQHYNYDNDRRWTSVFDTRSLQFHVAAAAALQLPENFRVMRIVGKPGYSRLFADYGDSLIALDSESLAPLWRALTPASREPGLALSSRGDRVYGLYPEVKTGCPCPEGRVQVTKIAIRLSVWAASTGQTIEEVDLLDRLEVPTATIGRGNRGYLALSPDDSTLYILWENRLWTLDADSLESTGELTLPSPCDGMALSADGRELYLLPTSAGVRDRVTGLWSIDAAHLRVIRFAGDWPRQSIHYLLAAPAPSRRQLQE